LEGGERFVTDDLLERVRYKWVGEVVTALRGRSDYVRSAVYEKTMGRGEARLWVASVGFPVYDAVMDDLYEVWR
jgi:hypothetical protein